MTFGDNNKCLAGQVKEADLTGDRVRNPSAAADIPADIRLPWKDIGAGGHIKELAHRWRHLGKGTLNAKSSISTDADIYEFERIRFALTSVVPKDYLGQKR